MGWGLPPSQCLSLLIFHTDKRMNFLPALSILTTPPHVFSKYADISLKIFSLFFSNFRLNLNNNKENMN